jgi:hypothetical protein
MTPERRELAIQAGRDMIEKALRAKELGTIENFEIFVSEDDPSIIAEILVTK